MICVGNFVRKIYRKLLGKQVKTIQNPPLKLFPRTSQLIGLSAISGFAGGASGSGFWECLKVFSSSFRLIFRTKFQGKLPGTTPKPINPPPIDPLKKGQINHSERCAVNFPSEFSKKTCRNHR